MENKTPALKTLVLPEGKNYQDWRNSRSVIFVCALAIAFMMGGIMANMIIVGESLIGVALALVTFFAAAAMYTYDTKALGLLDAASSNDFIVPEEANDSAPKQKIAA